MTLLELAPLGWQVVRFPLRPDPRPVCYAALVTGLAEGHWHPIDAMLLAGGKTMRGILRELRRKAVSELRRRTRIAQQLAKLAQGLDRLARESGRIHAIYGAQS